MGDDSEWMKLPTDEKVQHKVWKARLAGYEEATKLFQRLEEKSPEYSKYVGLMRKFVIDSNAVAQEKGLDAVYVFVENSHLAGRSSADVMSGIVTKCLNASKQKTKDKAMDIIMMYVEIEKQEQVQEALMAGLDNKQPKIVVGCITALRTALRDFGTKIISVKPLLKVLPKLLEDRDKNVREETKLLCIELYRWIGAALKPQMSHFKPLQVQELETEFDKLPSEKAKQCRFLRSQQDLKAKMEEESANAEAGGSGGEQDDGAVEEIDTYELIEAVDILASLPKDFYEKIEAKKWQERKEALEAVQKLAENPKIENGDFAPLLKCILKVIAKDSNVMLVAIAGKCLTGIAQGLRKKFAPYAANSMSSIIDKFKEKKLAVVAALRDASDAVYSSTTLEVITDDCVAALENKNPSIRTETALFLGRCFARCTQSSLPKKMLKTFCTSLLKTVNDTTGEVREASFQALGTAMRVVSEKNITPYLVDVDNIKMAKIQECCTNAVLVNAKGEPRSGGAAAAPAKSSEPKVVRPKTGTKPPESKPTSDTASKPAPKAAVVKKKAPVKGKAKKSGGKEEVIENALSDDAVEEKAAVLLPGDTLPSLVSSNWKERLAGMETFTQVVKGLSKDDIPCQACVRVIDRKPGLKDTNFQVLKLRLDLIAHLAKNSVFTKKSAEFCLSEIVDKVGDVKNGGAAQEALSCIAEATSIDFVGQEVVQLAFVQKNPKNQTESLNWLALSIKEFGFKINIKPMLETIKKAFAATNPAVRTSAITLLGVVYLYMGATLRVFFESEKPALLQQIDAEFEKVKGQKPNPPTRGLSPGGDGEVDDNDEAEEVEEVAVQDLVPRTDISEKITPELLEEMCDKNWKVRGEALSKVTTIIKEAKFITANIGTLPESLKARLTDSNKIMVNNTIGICQSLGLAMGPHCKNHVRVLGPGLIGCLADAKPQVRTAATNALNVWVEHTTLTPLVECEALSDALKLENPNLRTELLTWLSEKLPSHRVLPTELKQCIIHVLNCLEDRNGDVRKKAQESLVPFMIHTGYDSFLKATSKLKPASKDQIMAILEKARGNLPAKAPKGKKPTAAVQPVQAAPSSRFDDDDDNDDITPPKETKKEAASKKTVAKGKAKPAPAVSSKKKVEEDTSDIMNLTVPKEQRFKEERTLKVLKWNFTEIRAEIIEQLNLQMEKNFNKTIMVHLFHKDFKFHIKAIELLIKGLDALPEETVGNLDLILKWCTLRFYDTNPSMLNKALTYLQDLFLQLADADYHLNDIEAISFIPYLIIKVGDSKDNVRRDVRKIFKLLRQVYPASKIFTHLIDGLKSKNSKQRAECLEELGCLIESYGISICQPTPAQALKSIAQQISDRDNTVRNAALNTMVAAYQIIDEQIFKYVGNLNEKEMSYLQERLKRSQKQPKGPKINDERPQSARPAVKPQQPAVSVQRPQTAQAKLNTKRENYIDVDCDMSELSVPSLQQVYFDDMYESLPQPTVKPRPLSTTIGFVISQITNKNINTCIQALAQIDEVLKERPEILTDHVDQLVLLLSMQFKMVFSTCMGDENTSRDDIIRLYRCLLCTLLATFQNEELAKTTSKDILKDILNSLVTILLDNRLMDLDEGPQVVRSVNVTVIKIVENADYTNIMSALISLLQDCAGSEICTPKFLELIMKCLWRLMRTLPNTINELNIERTLLDCHLFLRAFPSSSWKDRSSDLPLRTIKTILHSLATLKGNRIFNHIGLISTAENSEIEGYLQKVLKNDVASTNAKNEEMNTEEKPVKHSSKPKSFSKGTQDMLGEIFKKIGSKENTKEGLNDLYDFKKKHPDSDLTPFLKKTSQFFQDYVARGLKNIEIEREDKKNSSTSGEVGGITTVTTNNNNTTSTLVGGQSDCANFYLERLKTIRSHCGLEGNSQQSDKPQPLQPLKLSESEKNSSTCSSSESLAVSEINYNPPEEEENEKPAAPEVDVSGLKMRLQRIKQLSNRS